MCPILKPTDYSYDPIIVKEVESKRGAILSESEHYCKISGASVTESEALSFIEGLWDRGLAVVATGYDGFVCLKIESLKKELNK